MSTETAEANEGGGVAKEIVDPNSLRCRFYENRLPKIDEVVMVHITEIAEHGAYGTLPEYDNKEGMLLLSELSKRRIRSVNKHVKVNKMERVKVIRVDEDNDYIDLSKKQVAPDEAEKCEERFNKAKAVNSTMRHIAETQGRELEEVYDKIAWPLYRKYGHAYDAFKMAISTDDGVPKDIFSDTPGLEVDEATKTALLTYVGRRLAAQPVKIRADIEVTCFTYDGIDAIKEALLAGEGTGTKDMPLKIKLIAPPMYALTCATVHKDAGLELMTAAIATISEKVRSKGGTLDVKMAPKVITSQEETEFRAMMARLAAGSDSEDEDDTDTPAT